MVELGSHRHELWTGLSPDAPDTEAFDDAHGEWGWVHSYETGSLVDGPGIRCTLFMSGCMLRCLYCHNPDTRHLKDGRHVPIGRAIDVLETFAPALRMMEGGLTISGGEPLVQKAFCGRMFAAAKRFGLHTALDTSGYLGARADDSFLADVDLVLLDLKSWDPATYRHAVGVDVEPSLKFARRLEAMGKPVWVRFVLVPGLTDDPDNVDGLARFIAPMRNVEWVEVLPFHQLGAFKWKALDIPYALEDTPPPSRKLMARVLDQFRSMGLKAR
ncbi:MAG: pyruvate formate-lyase-activating protein [Geminicoccaceae bacterium]